MKYLLLSLLLSPFLLNAQTDLPAVDLSKAGKGISPVAGVAGEGLRPVTYAVIIGISDYQDPAIPDLRFADKDAEAFANFLRSPAGGSLDGDHLKVLTNGDATLGQFAAALDWLWEVSKEGDLVILYFSGHGDVEKKSITQPGYLLCWDAPARVYMGGGAFALPMFQDVITTLSAQNKAKVVVITDACRSGKLAGSSVGGAQITGSNLARQYANEIKILSCQPDEYSIEGEQWGGGRGAFSYNLVNALYGLADGNNDLSVTLQEVGRYLEDHVTAEVAPVSQVPMVQGNRMERLATVDAQLLTALRSGKSNQMQMLSAIESRGMEDEVLAALDTSTRKRYGLFKKSLKDKVFLEPAGACADAYYELLIQEPKLARLHSTMKRNYAAALQDDAQQTLNEWLKTGQDASLEAVANNRLPQKLFTEKVRTYPRCLDRAAELLGSRHYMYPALKARKYFFEGYLLANANQNPDADLGRKVLALYRQSLVWQPEQPHVFWQISLAFGYNFLQPDSMEHYARLASEANPNWVVPSTMAGTILAYKYAHFERAKLFFEQASRIDSTNTETLNGWAIFNYFQKNFVEAERQIKKALTLDSTDASKWNTLGFLYNQTKRYADADLVFRKAITLDSTYSGPYNNLGLLYVWTSRFAEAEPLLRKAVQLDSMSAKAWNNLGVLYLRTKRFAEAEPYFKKTTAIDPSYAYGWANLGQVYWQMGRITEAEPLLNKAIALDSSVAAVYNNLSALYLNSGRIPEAEVALKKAIELEPSNLAGWANLGNLYREAGRFAEAEPILKKVIEQDSTKVIFWNNLGSNYLQWGRYDEAEPVLKKAIELNPTYAPPRKHLGIVCFKTKRPDEARQNFLKAIELNPTYAGAMLGMAYLSAEVLLKEHAPASAKASAGKEAIGYVEQAIGKGATFEQLESDKDLVPLRATPEWKELMKKYFPDKVKD